MGKVLKADASAADAYVELDVGAGGLADIWVETRVFFTAPTLALWIANGPGYNLTNMLDDAGTSAVDSLFANTTWNTGFVFAGSPVAGVWATVLQHHKVDGTPDFSLYVDGVLLGTDSSGSDNARFLQFGQIGVPVNDPDAVSYTDYVKIGTTPGGSEIFSDDFEDGTLDAWTTTFGDVSVVDDPSPSGLQGVVWAPTDDTLTVNPTWVRLDDPNTYNLTTSFSIVRGRSSNLDKVVTGTATLTFADNEGILDPTNPSSPFWDDSLTPPPEGRTLLDPMKQAAIALRNPVTDEWFTLFRGFISRTNHGLNMWSEERGLDIVQWELVDAFDLFANVILTHGVHGDAPLLASFPNIWYPGTPANSGGPDPDVEVHVDDRIVRLLDDAGWPGTGTAINVADLRNIFSGNVTVQGVVYARKDSMLSAIFDACDAEFPGIGNFYMSKDGVATFHGRYARFFPTRPGYGINQWYVGSLPEAALDPDVAPHANPLTFYRTADDIINSSYAIPQGYDESDPAVVISQDATSISTFGFRSENFDGLLVSAGHDDDNNPTTATEEANKFAEYYVGNFSQPQTRLGTIRFTSRPVDGVGGPAVWKLLTEIELGDVITLTSAHPGGGGFGSDFYVEQLRYDVGPGPADHPNIVLEVEVSPAGFFAYNPFGTVDGTA